MKNEKVIELDIEDGKVFELNGLEYIEDFDLIYDIIVNDLKINSIEKIYGPDGNIVLFEKNGIQFKLINNSYFPNSIMLIKQNADDNKFLYKLVQEIYDIYANKYPDNIKK